MIQNEESQEDSSLPFLLHPQVEARGPVQFCQNSIANLSKKEIVHAQKNFPM